METYVNSEGKAVTAAQAEQEYRKQLIVAGRPLEGDEYDRGLQEWLGTYRKLTKKDQRSINAAAITGGVVFAVFALIAFISLIAGAGLIAFIVLIVVGGFLGCGVATLIILFTSTKRD